MPIEFPCPQCTSLLRTPDSSVGKKAKCPNCGAITDVPGGTAELPAMDAEQPFRSSSDRLDMAGSLPASPVPQPSANPFAEASGSPFAVNKPGASENPYATPTAAIDLYAGPGMAQRDLVHTRIDLGQTLQLAWKAFTESLGFLVLLALLLIGLLILAYVVLGAIVFGMVFAAGQGNLPPAALLIAIPVVLVVAIVALLGFSWLEAGLAIVTLGVCRGNPVQLSDVFSGGRFTVQVVLLNVIRGILNVAIGGAFAVLGVVLAAALRHEAYSMVASFASNVVTYFVTLLLLLTTYFIVDRKLDVMQAMSASLRFMSGNKLTVFGLHIVVILVSILAVLLTCGIGTLFVMPFFMVLTTMIYLLATGQPVAK